MSTGQLGMSGRGAGSLVLVASACMAVAPLAHAQAQGAVQTQVALTAGQATDAMGVASGAVTLAPTLMLRPSANVSADIGVQGTRFGNSQWAGAALGSLGLRAPLAPWLALTADGFGAWTTTSYGARYTSLVAVPALEATAGRFVLFGGARLAHGGSTIEQAPGGAPLPIGGGGVPGSQVETSRSARGAVYGAGTRFSSGDVAGYAGYREERMRAGDVPYVDRSLSASAASRGVSYAATVGARSASGGTAVGSTGDASEMFASGSLTFEVRPGMSLQLAGARYPDDLLTGTVGGTSLSAGIVLRTGGSRAGTGASRMRTVRGVPAPARGVQRLVIAAPRATRVEIAGDWNDWKPVPATRAPDGLWYADVRVPPGRYRYAFRIDGSRWAVPEGVAAVDDGFGGRSAWLTVE